MLKNKDCRIRAEFVFWAVGQYLTDLKSNFILFFPFIIDFESLLRDAAEVFNSFFFLHRTGTDGSPSSTRFGRAKRAKFRRTVRLCRRNVQQRPGHLESLLGRKLDCRVHGVWLLLQQVCARRWCGRHGRHA